MKIDVSAHRSGKTTRMIEWLRSQPDAVLLTFSRPEADRLRREYPDVGTQIFDWEAWLRRRDGSFKEVAIDNADMVLQRYLSQPIKLVSLSLEGEE